MFAVLTSGSGIGKYLAQDSIEGTCLYVCGKKTRRSSWDDVWTPHEFKATRGQWPNKPVVTESQGPNPTTDLKSVTSITYETQFSRLLLVKQGGKPT